MKTEADVAAGHSNRRPSASIVLSLVCVGVAAVTVRVVPVLMSGGFPLNDGGLFYTMAQDLQSNSFVPPAVTSYNDAGIPFAYPPLGIYLVAGLNRFLPVSMLTLFTWLPLALCVLTVPAMYPLARELLASRFRAVVAVAAFAVVPDSYTWSIEGGGVTRALGQLLALLAVAVALRYVHRGDRAAGMGAAILGGLAIMSHPSAALFAILAILVTGAAARCVRRPAMVLIGMAVVAAPWWGAVLLHLGPAGVLSAGSLYGPLEGLIRWVFNLALLHPTSEIGLSFVAGAGFLGVLSCISRRSLLLPVWLAAELLVDQRLGAMYAAVPLCLAAAIGVVDVLLPALARITDDGDALIPARVRASIPARDSLFMVLILSTFASVVFAGSPASLDHALPMPVRQAFDWVAVNTAPEARFAVVTGDNSGGEGTQEWFPALTDRVAEATSQGVEWLGPGQWKATYLDDFALQACAYATSDCLLSWAQDRSRAPEYVFVPKGALYGPGSSVECCALLRQSLMESSRFSVVYDGAGATIFRWLK
jgi:hypothetical protein